MSALVQSTAVALVAGAVRSIFTARGSQPLPFGAVVGAPVRTGAVLSMLIPPTPSSFSLSALSTAVPGTVWSAPSSVTVTVPPPVQDLMPDSASEQVKPTLTSSLFQPCSFGAGARVGWMDGLVSSSMTRTSPVPTLPSTSVAVAVLVTEAVSAVTESDAGVGPDATPAPASVAVQEIVTSF